MTSKIGYVHPKTASGPDAKAASTTIGGSKPSPLDKSATGPRPAAPTSTNPQAGGLGDGATGGNYSVRPLSNIVKDASKTDPEAPELLENV